MNKKGFTLVELLAVIIVISILALFAIPRVLNQFSNNADELNDKEKSLVLDAAKVYVDVNRGTYLDNPKYCLNLNDLVNSGDLNEAFIKDALGDSYATVYSIRVTYNGDKDKHTYSLCKSSNCIDTSCN